MENNPKVIISVINDLVTDNRVHKVATSLQNNGFEVLLIGRILKDSLPIQKRLYQTKRMKLWFTKGPLFYAEINIRLFFLLLFKPFDIALSNDLDTLPANFLACKFKRKKLVYDSHEIFSEVPELVNRNIQRKTWLIIEKLLLPRIQYAYTVNQSVAEYYFEKYGIKMQVVRNIPALSKKPSNFDISTFKKSKKTIIYQGAINLGRGIELMIEAMQYLSDIQFVIIGDGDLKNEIILRIEEFKLNQKVKYLGKVALEELSVYTRQADIGISIEENIGLNYYYALPNKIFDYIHAGVPVLVSDFPEMKKLVENYKVGYILKSRDAKNLASQIEQIFNDESYYSTVRQNVISATSKLQWKNEEKVLLQLFK